LHHKAHHAVYQYEFQHAIPGHEAEGSIHSADLPYVFGYYPKTGNIAGPFNDTDFKLANLMQTYWTNFAKTGNPNSGNVPHWPELDDSQALIEFTQNGSVVAKTSGLRRSQCDLYREWLTVQIKQGK
jgi:para-nitrobenzyl esterase